MKKATLFILCIIFACSGAFTMMVGLSYFINGSDEWLTVILDVNPNQYGVLNFMITSAGAFAFLGSIISFLIYLIVKSKLGDSISTRAVDPDSYGRSTSNGQ